MDTLLDRFQAVLTVRGAESMFKIVEINDFKQVWERANQMPMMARSRHW